MSATGRYAQSSGKAKAMSYYGIAIAAATLIGHGAGGALVTHVGYNFLFYFGAGLLCTGVVLAFLLPAGSTDTNNNISKPMRAHCKDLVSLFSRGDLSVSYLAIFAQFFSFGGVVALLPLHVTSLGMEAVHVGMLLIIFSIMFIIVQFPAGNISDKKGRLKPTASGLILIFIALVLIPFSNSFATLAIALAIYGTGYGILFPAISALLLDEATDEEYGKVTGLFHALITAGVAVGAPVIGWIAAAGNLKIGLAMTPVAIVAALVLTLTRLNMKRNNYRSQ
jgi:MFS family permease